VAGAGLAVSLTGGLLLRQAWTDYAAVQREAKGCETIFCEQFSTRRLDQAEWKERFGTGALIVGGSALAAGLAGVLLNLPRARRSKPAGGLERLEIVPMVSSDGAGISVGIQF
jgi:hypothetical protein